MRNLFKIAVISLLPISSVVTAATIIGVYENESSFNARVYRQFNEIPMFNENDEIRDYFIDKDTNDIQINDYDANIQVQLDSYQQSNKLWHSNPKGFINMNYNTVIRVSNQNLELLQSENKVENIAKLFDNSATNNWSYLVEEWDASAGKRYMGNVILVPMWAPEVKTHHDSVVYSEWKGDKIQNFLEIVIDNIIDNVLPEVDFNSIIKLFESLLTKDTLDNDFYKHFNVIKKFGELSNINVWLDQFISDKSYQKEIINRILRAEIAKILRNLKSTMLKNDIGPNIISIDGKNLDDDIKFKKVNFGNVIIKYYDAKKIIFSPDHILPIIDYKHDYKCRGPTCSHNIRHMVDVVVTSAKNLILENFGNMESFFGRFLTQSTNLVLSFVLHFLPSIKLFIPNEFVSGLINELWNASIYSNAAHNILSHINKNMGELLFALLGKVEKHGIQLGKCGDLISGIKIESDKNHVIYSNDEKLVIYGGDEIYDKVFNNNGYNLNTIQCIVELKNYKDLYNFILHVKIDESIKNLLITNIKNLSLPSSIIYNQFINYLNDGVKPKIYSELLDSFKKFKYDGWKIPNFDSIDEWDLLCDYVLPNFFQNSFNIVDENNNQINFFNNLEFNKDINFHSYNYTFSSNNDIYEFIRLRRE